MQHTRTSILVHCVFATKGRQRSIKADLQPRLWAYIGGIARELGWKALKVGGTEDHVHVLLSLPPIVPVAKAVQVLKANSSRWVRDTFDREFGWQEGYGAFTIGVSHLNETERYIDGQSEHHRKVDSRQEFESFLRAHGIVVDVPSLRDSGS
jgi:putative transposase